MSHEKEDGDGDLEEQIVTQIRTHLKLNFTFFQFSEISGRDLLELLNTVLHNVSDQTPEKLGTEKVEATVYRISEFLRILGYEFPCEPEEWDTRLTTADKELVHPVLLWLLRDLPAMKKLAYKARYSEEVPVPEEIRVDPMVAQLISEHRELRDKFDQVMSEQELIGGSNVDELKKKIADLESDKARLATRVQAFKRRLAKAKNLDELLRWTSKLREETDREMKLKDQWQRLTDDKRLLVHRQQVAGDRLKNMKGHMEQKLNLLRTELASLKSQGTPGESEEKSLVFYQQQIVAATKRLTVKQQQLTDVRKKHAESEQELLQKQEDGAIEVPSKIEFDKYVKSLRQKNDNYKELQAEIAVYRKELAVVMRSDEIVSAQRDRVQQELSKIERARGVGGFREAREQLEKVSATKADLDDMKGKSLEQISAVAKDIQHSIQARQNELRPFVNQLQEQRKKKAAIEGKYLQAKQRHQNAVHEYDSVCMELDEETRKLRTDIAQHQTKYHTINAKLGELNRALKRTKEESSAQETGNPVSKEIKTYSDHFQKAARGLKKRTQDLKDQKKSLGNQSQGNQKQLEAFQSLRRLLQVKLECLKIAQKEKQDQAVIDDIERKNPRQQLDIE
jgi:intraflagellar transport protein 81